MAETRPLGLDLDLRPWSSEAASAEERRSETNNKEQKNIKILAKNEKLSHFLMLRQKTALFSTGLDSFVSESPQNKLISVNLLFSLPRARYRMPIFARGKRKKPRTRVFVILQRSKNSALGHIVCAKKRGKRSLVWAQLPQLTGSIKSLDTVAGCLTLGGHDWARGGHTNKNTICLEHAVCTV